MKTEGWFEVDKEGLSQLVRRKGMAFLLYELVQNAWDTQATVAEVKIEPIPNKAAVTLSVFDDDPDGFKDLRHAYTLFAPSDKKSDAGKRGRYNLGEKLVLAACTRATISTTTGTILFEQNLQKMISTGKKQCREFGSLFEATIPMTRAEMDEVLQAADRLLPPIRTTINGREIPTRTPLTSFVATLPTEMADEEGFLRRTARQTDVRIYEPWDGTTYLYELGIPVVELDLPWSVEIMQKVPLNADRDNVTPSYLRHIGVLVVNEMHEDLQPEDAALPVIQEALGDERVDSDAVQTILTHQYGEKRTVFDPSDPESNRNAYAHGYNVIPGGAFNKKQWAGIRRAEAAKPSGQLFPSPVLYDPDGDPVAQIPKEDWTPGMHQVAELATMMVRELLDSSLHITMENVKTQPYVANYAAGHLAFNVPKLTRRWFDLQTNSQHVLDLLIHEFGHHHGHTHLEDGYHETVTRLAAKLTLLALHKPGLLIDAGIEG